MCINKRFRTADVKKKKKVGWMDGGCIRRGGVKSFFSPLVFLLLVFCLGYW